MTVVLECGRSETSVAVGQQRLCDGKLCLSVEGRPRYSVFSNGSVKLHLCLRLAAALLCGPAGSGL